MSDWYWEGGSLRCRLLDRWQHCFLTKDQNPPTDALFAKQVHGNRCVYGLLVRQAHQPQDCQAHQPQDCQAHQPQDYQAHQPQGYQAHQPQGYQAHQQPQDYQAHQPQDYQAHQQPQEYLDQGHQTHQTQEEDQQPHKNTQAEDRLEADGLWLDRQVAKSIWVCSADCVPILVGDRKRGTVAAVHSGWRGTAAKILPIMVATLVEQGSNLTDLLFALGPAISGEKYQVGQEVADRVLATLTDPVGVLPDELPGHCRLDLRLVQQQQLLELGIPPEHIAIAPYCTYQNPHLFYSYRRSCHTQDGQTGKVQWSGITPWSPD
ncbi:MAG: peptidoglycan editing factor PgeF [Pseudanabaenaceae cyanobacterium SKYGB_i_bin29]|nr:peptidoglycan editing factor PgeF [Pseudanabaenaceae cyanobacterium SKYG29]MDW8420667.1 peptidoglycan editing factor PgeF [Pseudanabaenaceae cyanobacterium SKYGB_i_bin29]